MNFSILMTRYGYPNVRFLYSLRRIPAMACEEFLCRRKKVRISSTVIQRSGMPSASINSSSRSQISGEEPMGQFLSGFIIPGKRTSQWHRGPCPQRFCASSPAFPDLQQQVSLNFRRDVHSSRWLREPGRCRCCSPHAQENNSSSGSVRESCCVFSGISSTTVHVGG